MKLIMYRKECGAGIVKESNKHREGMLGQDCISLVLRYQLGIVSMVAWAMQESRQYITDGMLSSLLLSLKPNPKTVSSPQHSLKYHEQTL